MFQPSTISELQEAVLSAPQVLVVGSGTKSALQEAGPDVSLIRTLNLTGLVEYEPSEYVFTALAGTRLSDISAALAQHGQYLPCDPLLINAGSTLGGLVAGNASGPGRLRFGGVRDFLVGVRWVNGEGRVIRGGGKVVKNAAGFDFPKLMIGSAGRLGALAELSFKVFPAPQGSLTLEVVFPDLAQTAEKMSFCARQNWEVEALEIVPPNRLYLRIIGHQNALLPRAAKIAASLGNGCRILTFSEADAFWREACDFTWVPEGHALVKIILTGNAISKLDAKIATAPRRISMAGNVAYVAWGEEMERLHDILKDCQLSAVVWLGGDGRSRLGHWPSHALERKVKPALDPNSRFPDFPVT